MYKQRITESIGSGEIFWFPHDGPKPWKSIIVVAVEDKLFAYWNVCRHLPIPLDGGEGLLTLVKSGVPDDRVLRCISHGATFRVDNGVCEGGPCQGSRLYPLKVQREEGGIVVEWEEYPQL